MTRIPMATKVRFLAPLLVYLLALTGRKHDRPLTVACANGHSKMVRLLLEQGAVVDENGPFSFRYTQD